MAMTNGRCRTKMVENSGRCRIKTGTGRVSSKRGMRRGWSRAAVTNGRSCTKAIEEGVVMECDYPKYRVPRQRQNRSTSLENKEIGRAALGHALDTEDEGGIHKETRPGVAHTRSKMWRIRTHEVEGRQYARKGQTKGVERGEIGVFRRRCASSARTGKPGTPGRRPRPRLWLCISTIQPVMEKVF